MHILTQSNPPDRGIEGPRSSETKKANQQGVSFLNYDELSIKFISSPTPYHVLVNPQIAVNPPSGHDKALAERHHGFQPGTVRDLRVQGLFELQEGGGLRHVEHKDQRSALVGPAVLCVVTVRVSGLWNC